MNERIRELVKQSGGEFWQRIESDGVLNKEAYITFDPPQSLEKFAELIVRECMDLALAEQKRYTNITHRNMSECAVALGNFSLLIKDHFEVEE